MLRARCCEAARPVFFSASLAIDQQTFDRARDNHLDPTMCALNGGEDYELVFAIDLSDYEKIKNSTCQWTALMETAILV